MGPARPGCVSGAEARLAAPFCPNSEDGLGRRQPSSSFDRFNLRARTGSGLAGRFNLRAHTGSGLAGRFNLPLDNGIGVPR